MSYVAAPSRAIAFAEPALGTPDATPFPDAALSSQQQQQHLRHHHHTNHHHHYSAMSDPAKHGYYSPAAPPPQMACDIKSRLTKEQHEILEVHYQKQNKPNTQTKKSFADSLNVSVEKVNNWFQNRRAKSKQDAKKEASATNEAPPAAQQQTQAPSSSSSSIAATAPTLPDNVGASDTSSTSPLFASDDYFTMLQQSAADDEFSTPYMDMPAAQSFHGQSSSSSSSDDQSWTLSTDASLDHLSVPHPYGQDAFDGSQDLNRRTLTQEQFDAFAQSVGIMPECTDYKPDSTKIADADADVVLQRFFPDMGIKQSEHMPLAGHIAPPLSSHDSSVPSSISEQSMFPSTTSMQDFSSISTASSDEWAGSRSSSVSATHAHDAYAQAQLAAGASSTAQWQPGQSVPVDPTAQYQQFREAAQARHMQALQPEHPLAWPSDNAFVRRESHSSAVLTQQMSNFGLQTPAPPQDGTFKAPPPPASIAARRQRPRPAALGLASLRSQSYSGAAQTGSPGPSGTGSHQLSSSTTTSATNQPQLRRIRSSNVVSGVAPGRVMKSTPGSAQRSPLNWSFADAMSSPKALRHVASGSMGSLAPPTPMSPREAAADSRPQFPPWQSSFSRHASISETDDEHNMPLPPPMTSAMPPTFSSPPHTPMFHQYSQQPQFMHTTFGSNGSAIVSENTPPQSAPAIQQTFPTSAYMPPPPPATTTPAQMHPPQQQAFVAPPHPIFMNEPHAELPFHMPPAPPLFGGPAPAGPAPPVHDMPMHFAHGMPVVDAHGNMSMAFPPSMQTVHHAQPVAAPPQHVHKPAPTQFSFVHPAGAVRGSPMASNAAKPVQPPGELLVHEYSPPLELKRAASPRKTAGDSGPKNYTFANQTPEHFEKDKAKRTTPDTKSSSTASESPASTHNSL